MNISAVTDTALQTQQTAKTQTANGSADFADAMEAVQQPKNGQLRIFKGAPDFIVEWANKYNVHISKRAVPDGQNGPPTKLVGDEAPLPTVYIHPKALERMMNDPDFAQQVENEIARQSECMHRVTRDGVPGATLEGTSITVHENGNVTYEVFAETNKSEQDDWEIIQALMRKVDAICEEMHAANEEKVQRQLNETQKNRAQAEFQRIRVNLSPDLAEDPMAGMFVAPSATAAVI